MLNKGGIVVYQKANGLWYSWFMVDGERTHVTIPSLTDVAAKALAVTYKDISND